MYVYFKTENFPIYDQKGIFYNSSNPEHKITDWLEVFVIGGEGDQLSRPTFF